MTVVAEDYRNLDTLVRPPPRGFGLDGVWADDFHHQLRRFVSDEAEGYYRNYSGLPASVAETMRIAIRT